ncbi:hypothetical protein MASR2M39_04000 [Ignavibacteriales bacterium]
MVPGFATKLSPSFKLVSLYFLTAIVSLIAAVVMMIVDYKGLRGHHFSPVVLAVTHITILGWIALTIFGAVFQLISIILKVKLHSEKLAYTQYFFHMVGMILLVTSFYLFNFGTMMVVGGSMLLFAVILFLINLGITLSKGEKRNLTGIFLVASNIYLFLTVLLGLLLAINLGFPFISGDHLALLTVHAHLGVAGWIGMVIAGVSMKLIPMFTLSHGYSVKPAWGVFILLNAGVSGFSLFRIFGLAEVSDYIFAPMIALGFILFFYQIVLIIKKRMKKNLDLGIKFSLFAYTALVVGLALGISILFSSGKGIYAEMNPNVIYGFIFLFGFITQLIFGQMYKIIPFLIWFHYYSSKVGLGKVPLLKDLLNNNLTKTQYYVTNTALFIILVGLISGMGEVLLGGLFLYLAGALLFSYNIVSIYVKKDSNGN